MKPPHHYDLMMTNSNRVFEDYEDYEDYQDEDALLEAFVKLYESTILDQAYKKVTFSE